MSVSRHVLRGNIVTVHQGPRKPNQGNVAGSILGSSAIDCRNAMTFRAKSGFVNPQNRAIDRLLLTLLNRPLIIALTIYSIWVGFWFWVTIESIGDGGAIAHLWLTITGFPSALASWLLPHGSIIAVAVAGALGAIQLLALVRLLKGRKPKN